MKITTFLSVNNGNLRAIARMSNGTQICIVYKGVKVDPKQGFSKICLSYYSLALNPRSAFFLEVITGTFYARKMKFGMLLTQTL